MKTKKEIKQQIGIQRKITAVVMDCSKRLLSAHISETAGLRFRLVHSCHRPARLQAARRPPSILRPLSRLGSRQICGFMWDSSFMVGPSVCSLILDSLAGWGVFLILLRKALSDGDS
jgi:hypothetical protein